MNLKRRGLAAAGTCCLFGAVAACSSSSPSATPSASAGPVSGSPTTSSFDATAPATSPATSSPATSAPPDSSTASTSSPSTGSPSGLAAPTNTSTPTTKPSPVSATPVVFYTPYNNARYGFTADIPSTFKADAPPTDGDGLSYTGGRATLAVYGDNNVNGDSPTKVESELVADVVKAKGTVTYKTILGSVVVVSGTEPLAEGSTVVYIRSVVGVGSENTMRWAYPASEVKLYDPQVMHTVIDFHPGNVDIAH